MNKLLCANWNRLKREKIMWIIIGVMFLSGAFVCTICFINSENPQEEAYESLFFAYTSVIGILVAGFTSMFVGTEYGDGTMRNKIVTGHERISIYLANFISCTIAGVLFSAAFMAGAAVTGIPMFGGFTLPAIGVAVYISDALLLVPAFCALFTLLTMLVPNKARSVLFCMLLSFALIFAGSIVYEMLQAPEFVSMYEVSVDGVPASNEVPNPHYLRGMQREVAQTALDILPTGQAMQLTTASAPHPVLMAVYSVAIAVLANLAGCIIFKKKDLK